MRKIIESEKFVESLTNIFNYIGSEFGLIYTQKFLVNTNKWIKTLSYFPEVGEEIGSGIFIYHIDRKNWIYYKFTDTEIKILYIIDDRRIKNPRKIKLK